MTKWFLFFLFLSFWTSLCSIYTRNKNLDMKIYTTKDINDILARYNRADRMTRKDRIWFQNIEGVRKPGMYFSLTTEELREYAKCFHSIQYFADNFAKIVTDYKDKRIATIELRDYQKEVLQMYEKNRFSLIFKSRQVGLTVVLCILLLHMMLFQDNKRILIVANKGETAKEILRKLKDIYKLLPFYLKQGVLAWNEKLVVFENGSRIETAVRSKDLLHVEDYDLFYMDEFAKIPQNIIVPFYMNMINKMKDDAKLIIASGPNGYNFFYDLVQTSEHPSDHPGRNLFTSKRVYWWQVPGRRDTKIKILEDKLKEHGIKEEMILNQLKDLGLSIYQRYENNELWHYVKYDENNNNSMIWKIREMKIIDETDTGTRRIPLVELAKITDWKEEQIVMIGSEALFKQEYDLQFVTDEIKEKTFTWVVSNATEGRVLGPRMNTFGTPRTFNVSTTGDLECDVNICYGDVDSQIPILSRDLKANPKGYVSYGTFTGSLSSNDWLILNVSNVKGKGQLVVTLNIR